MATRSRLGRDPLTGKTTAAAGASAKKASPAKATPKTSKGASGKAGAKTAAANLVSPAENASLAHQPIEAAVAEHPTAVAATDFIPEQPAAAPLPVATAPVSTDPEPVGPIPASVALHPDAPEVTPEPTAFAPLPEEPEQIGPLPQSAPTEAITPAPEGLAPGEPAPAGEMSGKEPAAASPQPQDVAPAAPAPCPAAADPVRTAAIPPAASANARAVGEAHNLVAAASPPPPEGPHPAEVFLRGVLEGLTPAGNLTLHVEVDPETYALPVEKLFYFSHVLQLLVAPLEHPGEAWRRPGDKRGPVAGLTVRLARIGNARHSLRVFDNGLFFRSYLPEPRLDMEALRPLLLFVGKRSGSICLKQGRCIEFEIIG
ncbi:hypothetical protein [Solidesulfovibrio alcoholivorans]|uniref:hypothetical protein n=1 Tax=Solidesulfovibrio alcoholivorans TaxID=81406 RepID=UPI000495C230|nr:hypothetical protein [Solidesulfovibrio alcoholivorans]